MPMNTTNLQLHKKILDTLGCRHEKHLALGFLRYEALRKLNPRQFAEIHKRNLNGERFDDIIDQLITKP